MDGISVSVLRYTSIAALQGPGQGLDSATDFLDAKCDAVT